MNSGIESIDTKVESIQSSCMDLRWIGSVALLAVIAVAALFLFPIAHGSYSATHGPGTDLRAKHLLTALMFAITAGAFSLVQALASLILLCLASMLVETAALPPLAVSYSPLRR